MEYSKIERIENEIKDLHYNPKTAKHSFSDIETKELYKWFWDIGRYPKNLTLSPCIPTI